MTAACNSSATHRLLGRLPPDDPQAFDELFARHRERLRKMVRLRLDGRLRGRISSSAILQQVQRDAAGRLSEYRATPTATFFLWLRTVTSERLDQLHREHFGPRSGEAGQELSPYRGPVAGVSAASMAAQLLGNRGVHQEAARADLLLRLQQALNSMDPLDREIVALRNLEELSMDEAAAALGLDRPAATLRYVQALKRFNEILKSIAGFFDARPGSSGGSRP
jgi:RNA polymerase sigma-70 factor (ECF subfamily)